MKVCSCMAREHALISFLLLYYLLFFLEFLMSFKDLLSSHPFPLQPLHYLFYSVKSSFPWKWPLGTPHPHPPRLDPLSRPHHCHLRTSLLLGGTHYLLDPHLPLSCLAQIQTSVTFIVLFCFWFFLAVLGLCCCTWAFSSFSERGLLFVAVRRLLIVVASLVVEHGL